ncbi:hypothetical protein HNO88_004084 [Novosphingobium chloroacetimidivorans]|uniref:Uncharacterized protein n=1 Tax=Novosphingobium chloroacetimidivorans TaxID=1428314 RepID=A0A7W7KEF5_9SPHN|nr:hypothetical protein [Novosphingobium chloroacetimidivorans]MBB4860739.1 hypothetical protein [Novosphingobium chloroacetimidivorans]
MAIASIILAIGPIISGAVVKSEVTYFAMAIVAAAFAAGAARSIIVRTEESRKEIAARISSVSLARQDSRTALSQPPDAC